MLRPLASALVVAAFAAVLPSQQAITFDLANGSLVLTNGADHFLTA